MQDWEDMEREQQAGPRLVGAVILALAVTWGTLALFLFLWWYL